MMRYTGVANLNGQVSTDSSLDDSNAVVSTNAEGFLFKGKDGKGIFKCKSNGALVSLSPGYESDFVEV